MLMFSNLINYLSWQVVVATEGVYSLPCPWPRQRGQVHWLFLCLHGAITAHYMGAVALNAQPSALGPFWNSAHNFDW